MDIDEEFNDPNTNFLILMKELEQRIKTLQNDLQVIQDPELRGFENKLYRKLKVEYFMKNLGLYPKLLNLSFSGISNIP